MYFSGAVWIFEGRVLFRAMSTLLRGYDFSYAIIYAKKQRRMKKEVHIEGRRHQYFSVNEGTNISIEETP